jgi:hypothetical protein
MKLYERCIRFVKNVTTTVSDDQNKVVDLLEVIELYS